VTSFGWSPRSRLVSGLAEKGDRLKVEVGSEDGRYHRQELISWWDQERLSDARVLVVGAGALGNELLKNLALLGVGHVIVIDMDRIENSNLSRCVLFRARDEERYKAEAAAAGAKDLNEDLDVKAIVGDVRVDLGLRVFADADVVLGGLDNREARLYINQICWKVGTPWIDGAIEGLMGTMRVFVPPDSACYECTMNERDHQLIAARKSCALLTRDEMLGGKVPTTATTASVIAGMQAQEAIKLLHADRIPSGFAGRGVAYNGLTHDSYVVTYPRREDCLSHDTYELSTAAVADEHASFHDLLVDANTSLRDPVLELEREIVLAFECGTCDVRETVLAPLEQLTAGAAVCPRCGSDRKPSLTHSVSSEDQELLALEPHEVGLPAFDAVTARSGLDRRHYLLGGVGNAFDRSVGSS
jgi:molybdopterin/thiamine biosynthesis adenylyltransferase